MPYDIGASENNFEKVLQKTISSDELSLWLRDIDAGEMMMIVDACHSAAAVQGAGFKPGPMGSRGLGQLSYDKGMRILTATQADKTAAADDLMTNRLVHLRRKRLDVRLEFSDEVIVEGQRQLPLRRGHTNIVP